MQITRKLVEEILGKESVVSHGARSSTPADSITAKLYELLRNSPARQCVEQTDSDLSGHFSHSMLTERAHAAKN